MAAAKEITYADASKHNTRKSLYLVIHDGVYDATGFVDEHPGGEEVLEDLGGLDATEAFEDVGHSDEARETLETLRIGNLKRVAGDAAPAAVKLQSKSSKADSTGLGVGLYALVLIGGACAFGAYKYLQANSQQ
ncbi:MAG: hypothetical protein M1819_001797 [Sarea resinae]|nr:MAG: hypothetical protein M1819_001797 [Sarea resinae]